MFIENEFYHEYMSIVNNAKLDNRFKGGINYYESHHIIPKSMNGNNSKENLVLLTAQEHYRCHEILPFFTEGKSKVKMIYAWNMMSAVNGIIIDNTIYQELREAHSFNVSTNHKNKIISEETKKLISENHSDVSGKNNPMYGVPSPMLGKKDSQETKDKKSRALIGKSKSASHKKSIKDSWNTRPLHTCPHCGIQGKCGNIKRWHFDNCKLAK